MTHHRSVNAIRFAPSSSSRFNLGIEIIGLDIEVNSAIVLHF